MSVFSKILSVILIITLVIIPVSADGGCLLVPDEAANGKTFTVTLSAPSGGAIGGSGRLSFDGKYLTLVSYEKLLSSSWTLETNGANFIFYNNSDLKLTDGAEIFKVTFKVGKAGGIVSRIGIDDFALTDGSKDTFYDDCFSDLVLGEKLILGIGLHTVLTLVLVACAVFILLLFVQMKLPFKRKNSRHRSHPHRS